MDTNEVPEGGMPKNKVQSRRAIYSQAAVHAPKAIAVVVEALKSKNENVRLGAAKIILQKTIPDLKAVEMSGLEGDAIMIKFSEKYDVNKGTGFSNTDGVSEQPSSTGGA